ncbi:hypothetical protein N4J17_05000 [Methylococcus capsulatus]|uniref:Lipoprotein n=1 Tax=Methylococcus capsulatus TaxID=414 RepID=A0ABZ2F9A7_METCP
MKALVAGEAKLKLALCGYVCGLRSTGVAQAHQPVCQQGRNFAPALLRRHPVGW